MEIDNGTKIQVINAIESFPIGERSTNREELIAKASLVDFLSFFRDEISEKPALKAAVREVIEKSVLNPNEKLMDDLTASRVLGLSNGFVQDASRIQYLKDMVPEFNNTYNVLINICESMDLVSRNI